MNKRFTLYYEQEMHSLLEKRAQYNRRSINQEICYLIEAALAAESDMSLGFMRNVLISNGGIESLSAAQTVENE